TWTQALLRLRRDEPLLRLATTDAVQAALRFLPVDGEPGLVVAHLDGRTLPATHPAHGRQLAYVLNTDPRARTATVVVAAGGGDWARHPALEGLAEGTLDARGRLAVPGRSVAVFVR
ncbi:MAG: alpha-1,6-glucosidase domain-containing protein, partial [Silanimonas sp.]